MATTETLHAVTPQSDHAPSDPNVTIPKHVRDAAAAADALYKQTYQVEETPPPAVEAPPIQPEAPPPAAAEAPPVQHEAPHQDYSQPATPAEVKSDDWASRYNSMYGRWTASQRQVGVMQQQMNDLAAELQRTQELLTRGSAGQENPQTHKQLITDQDREQYGDDLIDVARRAAMEAVSPELEQLRAANSDLKKQVTTTAQAEVRQMLAAQIPNWVAINRSDDFKNRWLHLRNIYTGEARGKTLNAAYAAADAPRVIAIFNDYINEVKATGGELPGTARQEQQQVVQPTAPRAPAIQLETLAAPGRARPAGGDTNMPADKPTYTRQQIANFYADVRRNAFAGREADKSRIEQDIYMAQREGRVRA
jgi:hypothetical protein